ncbi:MAG: helix-turn-helix transcriptional regulator [Synergistota bacterium]|jgi:predicted XRE-type DNA-binding protein|nr:helix-turn-helix transcriptional regulator [Synergistota bacterium]
MIGTYPNVWDALEDSPQRATNLTLRSSLMIGIAEKIKKSGWTQAEAAKVCGITQPRMNDLLQGKISKFSLDALVNIATATGQKVELLLIA